MTRAIAAQDLGGFIDPVVQEKERYARHFDPRRRTGADARRRPRS